MRTHISAFPLDMKKETKSSNVCRILEVELTYNDGTWWLPTELWIGSFK